MRTDHTLDSRFVIRDKTQAIVRFLHALNVLFKRPSRTGKCPGVASNDVLEWRVDTSTLVPESHGQAKGLCDLSGFASALKTSGVGCGNHVGRCLWIPRLRTVWDLSRP